MLKNLNVTYVSFFQSKPNLLFGDVSIYIYKQNVLCMFPLTLQMRKGMINCYSSLNQSLTTSLIYSRTSNQCTWLNYERPWHFLIVTISAKDNECAHYLQQV